MYLDRIAINNGESNPVLGVDFDRYYEGQDLTVKWASEIAASPYNGDAWAWIRARIRAGNFLGVHTKDYIPIKTSNNVNLKAEVAGINTYTNYGDTAVGKHIDFICRELWPTLHVINKVNYNNGVPAFTPEGAEEEIAAQEYPWLACDLYHFINSLSGYVPNEAKLNPAMVAVDYTADGIYYYLPEALKNVIVEKRAYLPKRYSASGLLSDDNAGGWTNIGKLWLPSESEVYGAPCWGGKGGYSTMGNNVQYPIFAHNMTRLKYRSGSRYRWWLLGSCSGSSAGWCYVHNNGNADYYYASNTSVAAPVCFRVS